jgi:DNA-binding IclR family transcriptional regulator
VAAPIRDFSGMVQASVGCCLPLERLTETATATLAAQTIQTAAAISEELGFVVPGVRA